MDESERRQQEEAQRQAVENARQDRVRPLQGGLLSYVVAPGAGLVGGLVVNALRPGCYTLYGKKPICCVLSSLCRITRS